jgi:hypothetical protein
MFFKPLNAALKVIESEHLRESGDAGGGCTHLALAVLEYRGRAHGLGARSQSIIRLEGHGSTQRVIHDVAGIGKGH